MKVPIHVALIPDGNRRWAANCGLEKFEGYTHGLMPGLAFLRLAKSYGVQEVTYYGFTTDNCKRPTQQIEAFVKACVAAVQLIATEGVSLLVVGNTDSPVFPKELLPYAKERTNLNGGGIKVNFLVNYGWEWDLSSLASDTPNRGAIINTLHSKDVSRIDLIIRWGGMRRLSGLLPVQSVYADFYIVDSLWPDFQEKDFFAAMDWYNRQDDTLGG